MRHGGFHEGSSPFGLLILGKNLTTTCAKQLGLKNLAKTLWAPIFLTICLIPSNANYFSFSYIWNWGHRLFKKNQFKVKLLLHIFKIHQILQACILNLDRWSYIEKHRMENFRHIKLDFHLHFILISPSSSFITVLSKP